MTIDEVIAAMYASMCFEKGERPDWARHSEVFAPGARLVRVNDEGVFAFDPAGFREDLEAKIAAGVIPSFWEGELERDTRVFGDIAHVLSVYETRPSRDAEASGRAVKSIQLFRRDGRWWISAMIWRREAS
jgi:hypothetical protein